jgi:hypothetical protein
LAGVAALQAFETYSRQHARHALADLAAPGLGDPQAESHVVEH